ncbi:MAG: nicotinate (nicotinamide) nucleotide adenylyltransferase [Planctomycetes bacterium]|nr:nicotinate (nicotinamide) nucleotide adenylyltransferase [Planctomycetota bacterium]
MARVGILGGSFNPIHQGHVFVAEEVATRLALDRVLLMTACVPPHKAARDLAPAADRLAMVRLAAAGRPRLVASDLEILRGGTSYTIDTLAALAAADPADERFLIVGADSIAELPAWHRAAEIERRAQWVLVARPGYDLLGALPRLDPILTPEGRARVRRHCLEIAAPPISATEIRRRVRAGAPIRDLVPAAVADYIVERGLYRANP